MVWTCAFGFNNTNIWIFDEFIILQWHRNLKMKFTKNLQLYEKMNIIMVQAIRINTHSKWCINNIGHSNESGKKVPLLFGDCWDHNNGKTTIIQWLHFNVFLSPKTNQFIHAREMPKNEARFGWAWERMRIAKCTATAQF